MNVRVINEVMKSWLTLEWGGRGGEVGDRQDSAASSPAGKSIWLIAINRAFSLESRELFR